MKKIILSLTVLATIYSCSKDKGIIDNNNNWDCGYYVDMTWSQNVSADSLVGNWVIWHIDYSKGTGATHLFDTTYNLTAPLTLNANGTGTIYSTPLNWSLSTAPNTFPILTITNIDTLFPFPVNFIYNDTADAHIQNPPSILYQSRFFTTAGQGGNGNCEQIYLSFERQ